MCVIICLTKDQEIPYLKLRNATLNNPDGFGLIVTTDEKLEVYHKFDEKGNDPDLVARQLERWKDADMRYLHLRFATKGNKDKGNTHPFTVFKRDDHRIEFMHNGALHKYQTQGETQKSDTRQFAENFLQPILTRWHGENGPADIEDNFLLDLMEQQMSMHSRCLLVSNKFGPAYFGKWSTIKDTDGDPIAVSNDDYFDDTKEYRMTSTYKPKAADIPRIIHQSSQTPSGASNGHPFGTATALPAPRELVQTTQDTASTTTTEEQKQENTGGTIEYLEGRKVVPLKDVDLRKVGRFLVPGDLQGLLDTNGADMDDDTFSLISNLSTLEFKAYTDTNPEGAAYLLEHCIMKIMDLIIDNDRLADDKIQAQQKIVELKTELGYIPDKKVA